MAWRCFDAALRYFEAAVQYFEAAMQYFEAAMRYFEEILLDLQQQKNWKELIKPTECSDVLVEFE